MGSLQVVDGGFPVQRLAFAAELIPLLEPQVGRQELLTLAAVMADGAPAPLWRGRFLQPVSGTLVTTHGARRDYLDPSGQTVMQSQHSGVDIGAPFGTPIAAPADGVVAFAGTWSIRGNVVVLDHGAGVHSVHAHASSIAVAHGQRVVRGQVLGRVGSTGLSTGPHLHWEVRVGGVAVEPLEWTQRAELGLS
jgi:murein DD-endopeptidase MepM/ murein hydrolase activator NlpD